MPPLPHPQEASLEPALAGLVPDTTAAAAWLREERVTAAQLRDGAVTDADLEEAGLAHVTILTNRSIDQSVKWSNGQIGIGPRGGPI